MEPQNSSTKPYWAGLDWSDAKHVVVVVDAAGQRVSRIVLDTSPTGVQKLVDYLHAFPCLAAIALETTRALVVHRLVQEGFQVYPINPKMSAAWRDAWTVSGVKSDERDAQALAAGLAIQHTKLKPLAPETGLGAVNK